MSAKSKARIVLAAALLLFAAAANSASWELRPADGAAPGTAEIEAGRIEDAIHILETELKSGSADRRLAILENLCVAHALQREYDVAMRYCDQAAAHSLASAMTLNNRGVIRAVTGDYRGAIQDFKRAGDLPACDHERECEKSSVRALIRRNLARARQRDN